MLEYLDFKAQFLNEPPAPLPIEERLAIRYHLACERFDRTICVARDEHGDAIPSSQMERAGINRHASQVMRELLREYPECDESALRLQISSYARRYSTGQIERIAAVLGISAGSDADASS